MTSMVMYRMIACWSPGSSIAVRYGGLTLAVVLSLARFVLPAPMQHVRASWLRHISSVVYARGSSYQ